MKRFLLFEVDLDTTIGGLSDFVRDYDSIDTDRFEDHDCMYQTLDTQTGQQETYFWRDNRWMNHTEMAETMAAIKVVEDMKLKVVEDTKLENV